jgi:hypothetical protein
VLGRDKDYVLLRKGNRESLLVSVLLLIRVGCSNLALALLLQFDDFGGDAAR